MKIFHSSLHARVYTPSGRKWLRSASLSFSDLFINVFRCSKLSYTLETGIPTSSWLQRKFFGLLWNLVAYSVRWGQMLLRAATLDWNCDYIFSSPWFIFTDILPILWTCCIIFLPFCNYRPLNLAKHSPTYYSSVEIIGSIPFRWKILRLQ